MTDSASVQVIVYGFVQGVYFRDFTYRKAVKLGLTGYARNSPEGTVEVLAEGARKQLEELIDHLKVGPPAARVTKVETHWSEYTGSYSGFGIKH